MILEHQTKFKADHPTRPILILELIDKNPQLAKNEKVKQERSRFENKTYEIILEKFHSKANEAEQILMEIAEPTSITQNIQTFTITFYSLYTAMTLEWTEVKIIETLNFYAKNETIPFEIIDFIHQHTKYFNKASFYFNNDSYFLKIDSQLLDEIKCRKQFLAEKYLKEEEVVEQKDFGKRLFRVQEGEHVEVITELVEKFNVPVQQEYDYHEQTYDTAKKSQYRMKAIYQLYEHQKRALKKIFQNEKGHSGVVILPCGAGKTLLGINVTLKVKRRTLIICDSVNSVVQWKKQFLFFTHVDPNTIAVVMRQEQEVRQHVLERENIIVIVNQDMLSSKRPDIDRVRKLVWTLLIMDEVHGLPANKVGYEFSKLKANMKIGLTATPYRQDNKIKEIFYKVGPKLFESMIVDLTQLGLVSKIYCVQIQVGMYQEYAQKYRQFAEKNNQKMMNTLYQMNPKKYEVVQYLIDFHKARKDKILIFCEKINKLRQTGTLQEFAQLNKCPIILQDVEQNERQAIYRMFQEDVLDVIIFGQIADQGLDLPSANVGIQISFNFESVRQEFQRMGRIQRKKDNPTGEFDCFFYTIVSRGTKEVEIQFERQISVINQGYPYEIIAEQSLIGDNDQQKPELSRILQRMSTKILENQSNKNDDPLDDDGY